MPDRGQLRLLIALVILAAAGSLPGGERRDEPLGPRRAALRAVSRQMLQSGDWVVPRLYDDVRTEKPIFIYWCQAAAMRFLGDTAFAAQPPSALAMPLTLAIFGTFVSVRRAPPGARGRCSCSRRP